MIGTPFGSQQKEDKPLDPVVAELRMLAKSNEFRGQIDLNIRDRIVFGTADSRLNERMIRESPDLRKAIHLYRAAEATDAQMKSLQVSDK